ncbi:hypothetical protein [Neobacillus ginsengisoli]|uniref:Uncharacterized protein n=1 Tax=Neobacillus ginsengisoli TaxID=904295 RepID=A0ABT9XY09_9BACI|nr:hypothetical protein [Neobacillus ginsengisoli]MDQ0200251.1 hypothetical protein [Neobacillus ginsengisoli]
MKTVHTHTGKKRKVVELYSYKENNLVTNRKGCEFMRLLDVQPKNNCSYIFVQFPGMKMNAPMLSSGEGKVVKEDVALCVQLNNKEKVNNLYLVRTQSIKPFDFTDEEIGAKAFYRVIKKKEPSHDSPTNKSEDFVTYITDEVVVVQKKTESGYNFVLVLNNREIGIVASIEEEVLQTKQVSLQLKEEAKALVAVNTNNKKNMAIFGGRVKKRIFLGGYVFQDNEVFEPIRILLEGVKRKVTVFSPAALDFIGPGDRNQTIFIMRGW